MREVTYEELDPDQRIALLRAEGALKNAYNPYSNFYVGACLIGIDGELVTGTNFENSAYGSTICAERAAVLSANTAGVRKFRGIAITAQGENFDTTEVTGPCGACRQVLYEVSQISSCDLEIIMSTSRRDKIVIATIKELLPLAFGPLDLGINIAKYQK